MANLYRIKVSSFTNPVSKTYENWGASKEMDALAYNNAYVIGAPLQGSNSGSAILARYSGKVLATEYFYHPDDLDCICPILDDMEHTKEELDDILSE